MDPTRTLPPEIGILVLEFITSNAFSKRDLSTFSLVCGYWAHRCRPHLFGDLTLRSQLDLRRLLAFLDDPTSAVAFSSYIYSLTCEEHHDRLPWAHLADLLLVKRLPRLKYLARNFIHDNRAPAHALSKPLLPMTLPATLSGLSSVTHLMLQNYHVKTFRLLTRIVCALPKLRRFDCKRLSWDDNFVGWGTTMPRIRRTLADLHAEGCSQHWPMVWLFAGIVPTLQEIERLSPMDTLEVEGLTELAKLLLEENTYASNLQIHLRRTEGSCGFKLRSGSVDG